MRLFALMGLEVGWKIWQAGVLREAFVTVSAGGVSHGMSVGQSYIFSQQQQDRQARQTGKTDKQTIVIQICQHEIDKDGTPDRDKSRQAKSRSQVTLQDTSREHTQMGRKHCIVYLFPSHERSKKENRKEREETAPA